MSSGPTPDELWRDATWLAQAIDPRAGLVRFVEMSPDDYRQESFLDDRILQRKQNAHLLNWTDVVKARPPGSRTDARWIFHIGHVGSTLVSRLLGELDGVLAVREPRALRDLAFFPPEVRSEFIPTVRALMARTFKEGEIACLKATSFASETAAELVGPGERALFMYASPRNYIANILAGENSLKELRQLADFRSSRLIGRGIALPPARNDADRAAAAWATEMTTLETAAEAMPDRQVEWADFDAMLADMVRGLRSIAPAFGFAADKQRLEAIAQGPLMQRYSKAPEYAYSPSLRGELLEQEFRLQGRDIDCALAMLHAAAEKSPLLARALTRVED
jgi:hypothetical protein